MRDRKIKLLLDLTKVRPVYNGIYIPTPLLPLRKTLPRRGRKAARIIFFQPQHSGSPVDVELRNCYVCAATPARTPSHACFTIL